MKNTIIAIALFTAASASFAQVATFNGGDTVIQVDMNSVKRVKHNFTSKNSKVTRFEYIDGKARVNISGSVRDFDFSIQESSCNWKTNPSGTILVETYTLINKVWSEYFEEAFTVDRNGTGAYSQFVNAICGKTY